MFFFSFVDEEKLCSVVNCYCCCCCYYRLNILFRFSDRTQQFCCFSLCISFVVVCFRSLRMDCCCCCCDGGLLYRCSCKLLCLAGQIDRFCYRRHQYIFTSQVIHNDFYLLLVWCARIGLFRFKFTSFSLKTSRCIDFVYLKKKKNKNTKLNFVLLRRRNIQPQKEFYDKTVS